MSHPEEGLIHEYLDGECSPEDAARVEALIASDPAWAAAVAEARGLIAASSRILGALDVVPGDVAPRGTAPMRGGAGAAGGSDATAPSRRGGFRVRGWQRAAALLVLFVGSVYVLRETPDRGRVAPTADVTVSAPMVESTPTPAEPPSPTARAASGAGAPAREAIAAPAVAAPPPPVIAERRDAEGRDAERRAAERRDVPDAAAAEATAGVAKTEARAEPAASVAPAPAPSPSSAAARQRRASAALNSVTAQDTRGVQPERLLDSPRALSSIRVLDGCWRVLAPDSLRGVYASPTYSVGRTDSIYVQLSPERMRRYAVQRDGDALRGELHAERIACPTP